MREGSEKPEVTEEGETEADSVHIITLSLSCHAHGHYCAVYTYLDCVVMCSICTHMYSFHTHLIYSVLTFMWSCTMVLHLSGLCMCP